jgi:hypothetical protein
MWYGSPQWQIEAFWRLQIPEAFRERYGYPEITPEMKRKVLGLNSARLYGLSPDLTKYTKVPDDYHTRLIGNAQLMKTMEYDDRLPKKLPMKDSPEVRSSPHASPYGVASAHRNDRLEKLRAEYREASDTGFGVPRSNQRDGWIRVK